MSRTPYVAVSLLWLALPTWATDYFINDSSTTNDVYCTATGTNALTRGLSPDLPLASLSYLLANWTLAPGDRVFIDTGTYSDNWTITDADDGAPGNPVQIIGSPIPGGTVFTSDSNWAYAFQVRGSGDATHARYITIRNITIDAFVNPLTFSTAGLAIGRADNISVEGCVFKDAIVGTFFDPLSGVTYVLPGVGIITDHASATANTTAITIKNCVFYNNSKCGVIIWDTDGVTIQNCTFYNNGTNTASTNIPHTHRGAVEITTDGVNTVLRNNIIWASVSGSACIVTHSSSAIDTALPTGFSSDYNDLFTSTGANVATRWASDDNPNATDATIAAWRTATGQDLNSLSSDPLFANAAGGDFHLKSRYGYVTFSGTSPTITMTWARDAIDHSPCIDAGSTEPSYGTYANESEDNGDRVDMGAYGNTWQASRSGTGTTNAWTGKANPPSITPNSANNEWPAGMDVRTSWNSHGNWSHGIPNFASGLFGTVTIGSAAANPQVDVAAVANSITIGAGGVLNVTHATAYTLDISTTLTVGAGGTMNLSNGTVTVGGNTTISGNLTVAGGTMRIGGAITPAGNVTVASGATLYLDAGSVLKLAGGATLTVNPGSPGGALRAAGTTTTRVTITRVGVSGGYTIGVGNLTLVGTLTGGVIDLQYCDIQYGVVQIGYQPSTIRMDYVTFDYAVAAGRYIDFDKWNPAADLTLKAVTFGNTLDIVGLKNIRAPPGAVGPFVRVIAAGGVLGTEAFDEDPTENAADLENTGRVRFPRGYARLLEGAGPNVRGIFATLTEALNDSSALSGDTVEGAGNGWLSGNVSFPAGKNLTLRNSLIIGNVNGSTGTDRMYNCVVRGKIGTTTAVDEVYNCTVQEQAGGGLHIVGTTVRNCIIVNGDAAASSISATTATNNLVDYDPSNFVDWGTFDYHLKSGVTAINAGADLSSIFGTDLEGQARMGAWDIGADEYNGMVGTPAYLTAAAGTVQNEPGVSLADALRGAEIMRLRPYGEQPGVGGWYAYMIGRKANAGYLYRVRLDSATGTPNEAIYAYKLAGAGHDVFYLNAHKPPTQDVWHIIVFVLVDTNLDGYADGVQILRDYGTQANANAVRDLDPGGTNSTNGMDALDLNGDGVNDLDSTVVPSTGDAPIVVPNRIAGTLLATGDVVIQPAGATGRLKAIRFAQRETESDTNYGPADGATRVKGLRGWLVTETKLYKLNLDYYDTRTFSETPPGNGNGQSSGNENLEFGQKIWGIGSRDVGTDFPAGRFEWNSDLTVNLTATAGAYMAVSDDGDDTDGDDGKIIACRTSINGLSGLASPAIASWSGTASRSQNTVGMHIEAQLQSAKIYAVSSNRSQVIKFGSDAAGGTPDWNASSLLGGKIPTTKFFKVWASGAVLGGAQDRVFKLWDGGTTVSLESDWPVTALGNVVDLTWNGTRVYFATDQGYVYAVSFDKNSNATADGAVLTGFPYQVPGKAPTRVWVVTSGAQAGVYVATSDGQVAKFPLQ